MLEEFCKSNNVLLTVLNQMQTPATVEEIVFQVAELLKTSPKEVHEIVLRALENGIKCGCIQKFCDGYFLVPCDF